MASKPDLRGKRPQGPLGGVQLRTIPGLGKMPFKAGDVILTPQDRKNLEALGIRPDDPIPAGLAAEIAKVQTEVSASLKEFPRGKPAGSAPKEVVDISSLPAAKQKELRDFVASSRLRQASHEEMAQLITPGMDPSVAEAIRLAIGAEKDTGSEPVFHAQSVMESLQAKVAATRAQEKGDEEEGDREEEKEPEATPTGEDAVRPNRCPRCRWDLGSPQPPAPSPEDKATFVASILGDNRFVKSYPLFGGKLTIAFRSLATRVGDRVLQQLARDQALGRIADRANQLRLFWDYRLCLSLLWLQVGDDKTDFAAAVDEALEEPTDEDETTNLPRILERLQDTRPLGEETVWRVVSQAYRHEFQATVDGLEFQAGGPSF